MLSNSVIMRISLAQYLVVTLISVLFYFLDGTNAGISALMGGLSYAIPTTALVLYLIYQKKQKSSAGKTIIVGEFSKILASCLLMGVFVKCYENIHWLAFIVSIIAVVNVYFIVLFKRN